MPIDLNADLGEGCAWDIVLLGRVTSASLSCGAHAGDPDAILATAREALERGVAIGAHPGYPDRENFGRTPRPITTEETRELIVGQVGSLCQLLGPIGAIIRFLKPHGALYNQAQAEEAVALGVVQAAEILKLPVLGQPGSILAAVAGGRGVRMIREGFVDRRYGPDGRLLPRTVPGAVLESPPEIIEQIGRLVREGIETLCIHGDSAMSVALADLAREALARDHIRIESVV